jgi:hypothetical protein
MTWLVGGLLAAVLFGAGRPASAKEPFRPSAFDDAKALQGFWKTLEIDEHGAFQPMGLMLSEDDRFTLAVADADGKVVEKVKGHYTYASGVLTLTVDDMSKPYAEMHVEFADDALDLKVGAKKSHWVKDRVRRE